MSRRGDRIRRYKVKDKATGRFNEEDRTTKTQQRYNRWDERRHGEMCNHLRKAIDAGDKELVAQLKDQGIKWRPI